MGKEPKTKFQHYTFNFKPENLEEIRLLSKKCHEGTYIVMVCLKDRETCVITSRYLERLISRRGEGDKGEETQYNLQVHIEDGQRFRVYMNRRNSKKLIVDKVKIVPRKAFPKIIFKSPGTRS
jgi:hypothetical protein